MIYRKLKIVDRKLKMRGNRVLEETDPGKVAEMIWNTKIQAEGRVHEVEDGAASGIEPAAEHQKESSKQRALELQERLRWLQ